jgi:ParB-like chromosome segregation protein Spo0J
MNIEKVKIGEVKMNPNNPRIIKDDKFKKLVKSIKEFPEMLEVRPIVVDDDGIVLGGNMRLKACKEAGLEEISIIRFNDLSEERKKEFIVKDNVGYGEWDWEIINSDDSEWDINLLEKWGLDVKKKKKDDVIEGDIEFAEELLLEHNYVVLYFDNEMDWNVAVEKLGIKKARQGHGFSLVGVGRVLNGKKIIEKL